MMSALDVIEQGVFSECEITLKISGKEQRVYRCTESLRLLPGRRLTALAICSNREYVIKVFAPYRRAQNEFQSEIKGYELLHNTSHTMPLRVYYGLADDGVNIIIYQHLAHARTLKDIFLHQPSISDAAKKYFSQLIDLFVRFRRNNLIHEDPHLENFLLNSDKIYILDTGAVRKVDNEYLIDRNVALMFAQFPRSLHVESLWLERYLRGLGKDINSPHAEELIKLIRKQQQWRESHVLKKIYRECTAFHVRSTTYGRLIMDRDYLCGGLINVISDPEHMFDNENTVMLKQGNTSTVGIINVDNRQYVAKRYNIKNFSHRLKLTWRESRASRSWRNAHRLQLRGIHTAKPVALVECLQGRLKGVSLYVMEYVAGSNSDEFFRRQHATEKAKNDVAIKMLGLIEELATGGLVHGDLKSTNFIIHGNEPVLIDLDAMKTVNNHRLLLQGVERDRRRFGKNWRDNAEARSIFEPLMAGRV